MSLSYLYGGIASCVPAGSASRGERSREQVVRVAVVDDGPDDNGALGDLYLGAEQVMLVAVLDHRLDDVAGL